MPLTPGRYTKLTISCSFFSAFNTLNYSRSYVLIYWNGDKINVTFSSLFTINGYSFLTWYRGLNMKVIDAHQRTLQCNYSNWDTWKKIVQTQRFLETKDFQFFLCKRTNNIPKFESCFLRGRLSSNGFKVFKDYIVVSWNSLDRVQRKNGGIFCFQKWLWLENLLLSAPVRVVVL